MSICDLLYKSSKVIIDMAEMVGFEPTDAIDVNGFQDRLFKPLRHISIFAIPIQF